MRALIIDDDALMRLALKKIILRHYPAMQIEESGNGMEGIILYENYRKFDIIIVDLLMPEMTGDEFLEHVRVTNGDKTTPVVICTALTDRDMVFDLRKKGLTDFIVKPVNVDTTVQKLKNILGPAPVAVEPEAPKPAPAPAPVANNEIEDNDRDIFAEIKQELDKATAV